MRVRYINLVLSVIVITLNFSCSKKETVIEGGGINDFVWGGLNAFYKWQTQVDDLSDERFTSANEINSYLSGFNSPKNLFNSLLHTEKDTLSQITDNYFEFIDAFEGVTTSNGMKLSMVKYANKTDSVYAYVRYVVKNSDADIKGVKRGVVFNRVNGKKLRRSNFKNLIDNDNYTITLSVFNNGNPVPTTERISLTKSRLKESSIIKSNIIEAKGEQFAYIAFSRFIPRDDNSINEIFKNFVGLRHIILDLRYCNGGAIETSAYLASMVTGQFKGKLFTEQAWNSKVLKNIDVSVRNNYFTDLIANGFTQSKPVNSMNLNNIYVLTSKLTAGAAEVLINSLKPYVNVNVFGTKTAGQFYCNTLLFDADDYNHNGKNFNKSHSWATFPVAFEAFNSENENESNGIKPNIEINENPNNMGELGDVSDPLIQYTVDYILSGSTPTVPSAQNIQPFWNSENDNLDFNKMYVNYKPIN